MDELTIGLATAVVSIMASLFKAISFVQEGELGIKLRFGKAQRDKNGNPKIIHPGWVLMIPFVETLKRHHVRQQTLRMKNQKVMIKGGFIFDVSAIVIFRVKDIYRALFEINDLDQSVEDISMGILRDVLSDKEHGNFSDMESISEELLNCLQKKADEWGVTFIQFKLTNCAPTTEAASAISAKASVMLRLEALINALNKIGCTIKDLSPGLACALIGIPLVTAVPPEIHIETAQAKTNSLINIGLGGDSSEAGTAE